jgi:hypothetical protein
MQCNLFKNSIINESYEYLLERHSDEEANYILTNSLAILGDKKIQIQNNTSELPQSVIKRIDKYKYPERLASFVRITSEKSNSWKEYSFAKIACT